LISSTRDWISARIDLPPSQPFSPSSFADIGGCSAAAAVAQASGFAQRRLGLIFLAASFAAAQRLGGILRSGRLAAEPDDPPLMTTQDCQFTEI